MTRVPDALEPPAPQGADEPAPPVRVMLVDDHRMFAESLARLLGEEPDIEVVGVAGGPVEAEALAAREVPDVVLVDYALPDQDGVALTRRLKAQRPETLVVMLTGSPEDRIVLAAIEAGCSGFLTKDRAAAEVTGAIRAVAAGEALISPGMLARLLPQLSRNGRGPGPDHLPGGGLTAREREVLDLLAEGLSNRVIADRLFLSVNTVRNYVQSILTKLDAHSKLEAVSSAARAGLINLGSAGGPLGPA